MRPHCLLPIYQINEADQVRAVTNPPPAAGLTAPVVQTFFDSMGRGTNVLQTDGVNLFTAFYPNGLVRSNWGARTYPVA